MNELAQLKSLSEGTRTLVKRLFESEETSLIIEASSKTTNIDAFLLECKKYDEGIGDFAKVKSLFEGMKNDLYALSVINNKIIILKDIINSLK